VLNPESTRAKNLIALALLLVAGSLLVWAFGRLPIQDSGLAIDWKVFWEASRNLRADYSGGLFFSPPWVFPLLWPFSLFPLGVSWGLAACVALAVLIVSVPREFGKRSWLLGVVILCGSYPALRQFVDGNLEAIVIGGTLLVLWALPKRHAPAMTLGVLLLATKLQASWLCLLVLFFWIYNTWPRRELLKTVALTLTIVATSLLWKGGDWWAALQTFPFQGTAIDSSLWANAEFMPPLSIWVLVAGILLVTLQILRRPGRQLGRIEIGALLAAGLLLSPYAASNSVLTQLAIGVIPLVLEYPALGFAALTFYFLPYIALSRPDLRANYEGMYWTGVLLLTWLVLIGSLWLKRSKLAAI
jgi:hypothetical protein